MSAIGNSGVMVPWIFFSAKQQTGRKIDKIRRVNIGMIKEVLLPKLGLTMEAGTILSWLKKEGDYVEKGEPLFEIETDKTAQVLESFHSGYIKKILVDEGQEVPIKTVIAYIGDREDRVDTDAGGVKKEVMAAAKPAEISGKVYTVPGSKKRPRINASPLAKRLAAELGVDLSGLTGSGPDGRIGKEDVLAASERIKKTGAADIQAEKMAGEADIHVEKMAIKVASRKKLTGIKRIVAERIKASYLDAPHIHLELSADMTGAENIRTGMNSNSGGQVHITFTDILTAVVAKTIRKNIYINSTLEEGSVVVFDEINIGIATATERGLVVPVLKNADRLSLKEISELRHSLIERTIKGRQTPEDLSGGTFTITNLGMFGIESFKPVLNPGQAAILAVGKILKTPVADDAGTVSVKPVMKLSLACDHRIVDGAEGAKFLSDLKEIIENPADL